MSGRSVNLTTLFLGRLRPPKRLAGPRSAIGRAPDSLVRGPGFDTRSGNILSFLLPLFQEGQLSATGESMCTKYWLTAYGCLSLPRKSVVTLTDRPDMTLDVYRGRKTTMQQQQQPKRLTSSSCTYFRQYMKTALFEKAEGETKVCCQTGYRTQDP